MTHSVSTISTAERVSSTIRQSLIDHLTYSSLPSAHQLANHHGTDTSTNPVHTSFPGPHHAHYPNHANVVESAGHALGTTIHVDRTVNASSLSRAEVTKGVLPSAVISSVQSLTNIPIPGMVRAAGHRLHIPGPWSLVKVLMMPNDYEADSGVGYMPPQYVILGVQRPPTYHTYATHPTQT